MQTIRPELGSRDSFLCRDASVCAQREIPVIASFARSPPPKLCHHFLQIRQFTSALPINLRSLRWRRAPRSRERASAPASETGRRVCIDTARSAGEVMQNMILNNTTMKFDAY